MDDGTEGMLHYPWPTPPAEGEATEIAEGVLWLRLPLPMTLDHVNIYALDDGDSWTIVDTGIKSRRSVALWEALLDGPLLGKPVGRVLITHHHPDHVGMAGWLMARMLILDEEDRPTPQALDLWRKAGMDRAVFDARANARPFNFADSCHSLPVGYTRLKQGDMLRAGGRDWNVHVGHGHAPEHLTLWSGDGELLLAGDQIIASISPNIGVYPTEPEADPLADWLESCARFAGMATPGRLVLPGHKLPFTGLPVRMRQLVENHTGALERLRSHLRVPRTAGECFAPLFKRKIDQGIYGLALVEAVAHLNHLHQAGEVERRIGPGGAWLWRMRG